MFGNRLWKRFHKVSFPLVLVDGAYPQILHIAIDDVQRVYLTTWHLFLDLGYWRIAFANA